MNTGSVVCPPVDTPAPTRATPRPHSHRHTRTHARAFVHLLAALPTPARGSVGLVDVALPGLLDDRVLVFVRVLAAVPGSEDPIFCLAAEENDPRAFLCHAVTHPCDRRLFVFHQAVVDLVDVAQPRFVRGPAVVPLGICRVVRAGGRVCTKKKTVNELNRACI